MSERRQLALAAAALLAVFAVATTTGPFSDVTVNDLYVYEQYARLLHDGQLPYLDFGFEYPPLAALPLWLAGIFGRDPASIEWTFAVLMALCLVAGQQLAARLAGGGRAGVTVAWLLVLSPVLIGASVRTHFDPLPIAIALGGLLMLSRERHDLGFLLLGVGTMTKLFPGLLAVVALAWLAGRGQWREAVRAGAIFTAIVLAISLPFAGAGYVDSFRFHLDRPVQIESTAATVLFALGGSDVTGTNLRPDRFKSNGLDGGHADTVEAVFAVLLVLALAAIVLLAARRRTARHVVLCGLAALLAFVTLGKVFSPQYVIWLAPFTALAWAWGQRAVAALVTAGIVLTHVEFPSRYFDLINAQTDVVLIVAARNALLLAALGLLASRLWVSRWEASACAHASSGDDASDASSVPLAQPRPAARERVRRPARRAHDHD
ncbi:MAG TPA: glycosyltransferase family 87 protein [Solirubrobacteraceae bacterium]|nr:glycosyltransferase family 87 protein [Solirubrobacteraceae bacterium]